MDSKRFVDPHLEKLYDNYVEHNKSLIKNKHYTLDENYKNESEVKLIDIYGTHFGKVRDEDGYEWDVMLYRLTEIK